MRILGVMCAYGRFVDLTGIRLPFSTTYSFSPGLEVGLAMKAAFSSAVANAARFKCYSEALTLVATTAVVLICCHITC